MKEKLRAVIIDDMDLARVTLRQDIADFCPEVEVVGEADGVLSALKLLKSVEVDLLFLDIDLGDGLGFDILELAESKDFQVIFTTASEDHAIQAFRVRAIDYLLKPIDPTLLQEAVAKVNKSQTEGAKTDKEVMDDVHLSLHTQDRIYHPKISEIIRCEASGNYTYVHLHDGSKIIVAKTLRYFDNKLTRHGFIRTHQSHLIHKHQVKEFVKSEGGYLLLKDKKTMIPISVRKRAEVLAVIFGGGG